MPHDVVAVELDEREVGDAVEDVTHREQSAAAASLGQVDLGDVAGDDDLGAEPEPGQEHLHLLGGGVLRFVEDDERVVERATAHERERRDLDGAALHQPGHDLRLEHVVQRVVERAEVRVDLGEDVAGEEAESLARFDRGAGEDDAVDLLGLERLHRERHREVALAGAGGPDAERDGVRLHRVDVALLTGGLRSHRLASAQHLGGEHVSGSLVGLQHLDAPADTLAVQHVTGFEQRDHLFEQPSDAVGFVFVAPDGDLVPAHVDLHRERVLHEPQQFVALAEQAHHQVVARYEDLDLGRRRCWHVGVSVPGPCAMLRGTSRG